METRGPVRRQPQCWGRDDIGQVWPRKLLEGEDQHLYILVSPKTPVMVHYLIFGWRTRIQYGEKYQKKSTKNGSSILSVTFRTWSRSKG